MTLEDIVYQMRGINPSVKKAYVAMFNGKDNAVRAGKVLTDLMVKFKYYGAKPTTDPIQLAKNAAYREVIEYILTMSARISEDTLRDIEHFINNN